tara:strand:+ start:40 stop:573 length:534 start_codon:yes stop_codon:yes gene_type:complete
MNFSNPIKLIVPLAVLKQTRKFKFHHSCSGRELSDLTRISKVERLEKFSFKGQITQKTKHSYVLTASLSATLVQLCVLSLSPIKTSINHKIKEIFSSERDERKGKKMFVNYDAVDTEQLLDEVNIGDIMFEALNLEIPLYPKKKDTNFEGLTITKDGIKPLEIVRNKPFISLKKYDI